MILSRLVLITRNLIGGIIVASVVCVALAVAADPDLGPLPDFSKGAQVGVHITPEFLPRYRSVLPPLVFERFKAIGLEFDAALQPHQKIPVNAPWMTGKGATLDPTQNVVPSIAIETLTTWPLSTPTSEEISQDGVAAGKRILWNATAHTWGLRCLTADVGLRAFGAVRTPPKAAAFQIARLYPRSLDLKPTGMVPFMRERVDARMPKSLLGLSWLTLRFAGDEEDYVWISSAGTGDVRQVTGSNRSDTLFLRGFALDDLFVWSAKVEDAKIGSTTRARVLVPINESPLQWSGEPISECQGTKDAAEPAIMMATRANGWAIENVIFVLRDVFVVDLFSRDPFALDSKTTLYVDSETLLPVYKIVWGGEGRLRKIVMGVLGAIQGGSQGMPFWRGEFMLGTEENSFSILDLQALNSCNTAGPRCNLKTFDPVALRTNQGTTPQNSPSSNSGNARIDNENRVGKLGGE